MNSVRRTALLSAVAAVAISSGLAKADVWSGSFSAQWTLGGNWQDLSEPGAGDAANFTQLPPVLNTFINLDANRTVLSMRVNRASGVPDYKFTRTNNALLTVTNGLVVQSSGGTLNNSVEFDGFRVNAGSVQIANNAFLTMNNGTSIDTAVFNVNDNARTTINNLGLVATDDLNLSGPTPDIIINSGGELRLRGTSLNHDVNGGTLVLNTGGTINIAANGALLMGGGRINFNRDFGIVNNALIQVSTGSDIVSNGFFDVGRNSTGRLLVDGAGSTVTAVGTSDWGFGSGASATVNIQNGATGSYGTLRIGTNNAAALAQAFGGATLQTSGGLEVGGGATVRSVVFNVANNSNLIVAGGASFNNQAVLSLLADSSINFNGGATFNAGSTFNWNSGNVNIASGQTLAVAGGVINKTGGAALSSGATLRITAGTFTTDSFFDVGNGTGFTGNMIVDGVNARFNSTGGTTDWGQNVGNFATISFANGGAGTYSGALQIADNGGRALVNFNSNGQLNANNLIVGGTASAATINIAGGTLNAMNAAQFNNGALVNLTNGGLVLAGNTTFNTGATLNKNGGALNFAGQTLAFAGGVGSFTGSYSLPNGATVRVTNGGRLDLGNFLDIANGQSTGTLFVDGANSRVTTTGATASDWGFSAGQTATVTFSNGGAGTFSGLDLSNGGGRTELSIASGGNLNVTNGLSSGGLNSTVNVNISGGSLNSINDATFANGSNVNVTGTGVLRLGGNSTFSTGSTFNGSPTGGLSRATNTTLAFDGGVGTFQPVLDVADGQTLRITNGGSFTAVERLRLATFSGAGTLVVDGPNSLFQTLNTAASFTNLAQNGGTSATITISNSGVASFATGVQMGSNGGNATININSAGLFHAPILTADGLFGGSATISVNGGTLRTTGDTDINGGATLNFAAGTVNIGGTLGVGIVNPNARVLLTTGANKVLRVGGLNIPAANGGKIDLADNAMIVDYTGVSPLPSIRGLVSTGRAGGAWNGPGITSAAAAANSRTALGLIEATDIGSPAFAFGLPIDNTTILTRFVFLGDSNLDGTVNISDFSQLATAFNVPTNSWFRGDYNFDGTTGIADFSLLASNFNLSLSGPLPRGAAVPEPACALAFVLGTALARRRRV